MISKALVNRANNELIKYLRRKDEERNFHKDFEKFPYISGNLESTMCAQGCEKSYSYETTQKKSWKDFKLLLLDDLKALW